MQAALGRPLAWSRVGDFQAGLMRISLSARTCILRAADLGPAATPQARPCRRTCGRPSSWYRRRSQYRRFVHRCGVAAAARGAEILDGRACRFPGRHLLPCHPTGRHGGRRLQDDIALASGIQAGANSVYVLAQPPRRTCTQAGVPGSWQSLYTSLPVLKRLQPHASGVDPGATTPAPSAVSGRYDKKSG